MPDTNTATELPAEANPPQPRIRRKVQARRILVVITLGVLLVWGALFGAAKYFFGWRDVDPPAYHESWSKQQQAELLAMDKELRSNTRLAVLPALYWEDDMGHPLVPRLNDLLGKRNAISAALNYKEFVAPVRQALHEAISTGKGDIHTRRGEPLAVWALRLQKPDLFLELVKRGADVNREYKSLMPTASFPRTLAIEALSAEYYLIGNKKDALKEHSPEAHIQQLNALLPFGPELGLPHLEKSVCDAICVAGMAGSTEAALWALRHGYKPSPESRHLIRCLQCSENMQTALRELLKEPSMRLETSYPGQANTTLQFLMLLEKLPMRDKLELARLLLESGSDPNMLPPGSESCQSSVLALALKQYMNCQETEREAARELIRLLRQHGATLTPGEKLSEQGRTELQVLLTEE